LPAFRELDDALGLTEMAGHVLTGKANLAVLADLSPRWIDAVFQMAEAAVARDLFRRILDMIDDLRPREPAPC
jgi:hypothetical protein